MVGRDGNIDLQFLDKRNWMGRCCRCRRWEHRLPSRLAGGCLLGILSTPSIRTRRDGVCPVSNTIDADVGAIVGAAVGEAVGADVEATVGTALVACRGSYVRADSVGNLGNYNDA